MKYFNVCFVCFHLLFQQTFTHQIYIICHENLIYVLGVTFADLREVKYSVAVLEQQEAGQTVCRPSINSEGFVSYMFIVGFQFVLLFYTGAYIQGGPQKNSPPSVLHVLLLLY